MAYKPSLAEFLYTDANTSVDTIAEIDAGQDQTRRHRLVKARFAIVVGPSPFSMPQGWSSS